MTKAKCNEYDYINFLVAAQTAFSVAEAAQSQPDTVVAFVGIILVG